VANPFDHEKDWVLAFPPGGNRVVDGYGSTQRQSPAALAEPEFPCLVDGFDEDFQGAAVVMKTEMPWHGGTTRRIAAGLPLRVNFAEALPPRYFAPHLEAVALRLRAFVHDSQYALDRRPASTNGFGPRPALRKAASLRMRSVEVM